MKLNVLVIDDSGVMRKLLIKGLNETRLADFAFTEAEDAQVGLDKLKIGDFDIAFVDWTMPKMTGLEFVKQVRKDEQTIGRDALPLVMVTGEKTGNVQKAVEEAGADGFISKPFTAEELRHKLKKLLDNAVARHARLDGAKQTPTAAVLQPQPTRSWLSKLFG